MRLILASGSPRRRELLSTAGFSFDVILSGTEEHSDSRDPGKYVEELSREKAEAVFQMLQKGEADPDSDPDVHRVILGADTVVALDGIILGKPKSEEQAAEMLRLLSGREHSVFTGVTLLNARKNVTFHEETRVRVANLSEEEIADYIATGEPMDKAGAYGIQGSFGKFVTGITGDYNNVVGLPVAAVYRELKALGMDTEPE